MKPEFAIFLFVFSVTTAFHAHTRLVAPTTRLCMSMSDAEEPESQVPTNNAAMLKSEAEAEGKTMFPIRGTPFIPFFYRFINSESAIANPSCSDFKDVPPTTIDDVLPGNKFEPGNLINIALFSYIGYLFIDSIRLLIIGATTTPPPGM